jgi:hypothetical protein
MAGPIAAIAIIIAFTAFVLPGDVPFIAEMATLLGSAAQLNATPSHFLGISLPFTIATIGTLGTRGLPYGPFPIWFYQALLVFSHNPVAVVCMRSLIFETTTAAALLWLTRVMRLSPWYVPLSMLSPWLWLYSREIWDNTFCIPLSALAVAGYGDFIETRRRWPLALAASCLGAMTLIHLMSVAMIGGVALHAFLFQRNSLNRFRSTLAAVGIVWLALFGIYFHAAIHVAAPVMTVAVSGSLSWWFPLLGGHHLAAGFDWLPTVHKEAPQILSVFQAISLLPYPAVWAGMILVVVRYRRSLRRREPFTTADQLALLSVITAVCQGILDAAERTMPLSHYFNATWICYVVLAWYAVEALRIRISKPALTIGLPLAVYASSLLAVLGISMFILHRDSGAMGSDFGASLSQQISVIKEIEKYSPQSSLQILASEWYTYPMTPRELLLLIPPPPGPRPIRRLVVRDRWLTPTDPAIAVDVYPYDPSSP